MAKAVTKTERILALYSTGKYTTREVADTVGCLPAYVRVVARQRKGAGYSDNDARYLMRRYGGKSLAEAVRNQLSDPAVRDRHRAANRKYRAKRRAEARA